MKRKTIILIAGCCLIISFYASAQQNPTGTSNSTITPWDPSNSSFAWFRGGNLPGGGGGTNNIFGTGAGFNSPIYTVTNGAQRTRLNGNLTTVINTFNVNTSGFFGISPNGFFATNSPASMLHLAGNNNTPFGAGGYRSWMRTGLFINKNTNSMYM
ncbi:MAG: hypothetical protein ACT4ON_02825 [Bacteroidota bacterium]